MRGCGAGSSASFAPARSTQEYRSTGSGYLQRKIRRRTSAQAQAANSLRAPQDAPGVSSVSSAGSWCSGLMGTAAKQREVPSDQPADRGSGRRLVGARIEGGVPSIGRTSARHASSTMSMSVPSATKTASLMCERGPRRMLMWRRSTWAKSEKAQGAGLVWSETVMSQQCRRAREHGAIATRSRRERSASAACDARAYAGRTAEA